MRTRHRLKTRATLEYLGYVILAVVLAVALGGIYFMFQTTGQATSIDTIQVSTIAMCTCEEIDTRTHFIVPSTRLTSDIGIFEDCQEQCAMHNALAI